MRKCWVDNNDQFVSPIRLRCIANLLFIILLTGYFCYIFFGTITMRESYTLTVPENISFKKQDLRRKNQSVPRSMLMSTFMGFLINQAKAVSAQISGGKNKNSNGLVGLRNLGNTCFMNSILQCLSNTPELRDYCLRYTQRTDISTCGDQVALMEEFAKLTKTLWTSVNSDAVSPSDFKTQIQRYAPKFLGYNQQDAQEFLRFLLDGLHNDVNRATVCPMKLEDFDHLSDTEKSQRMWNKYREREDSTVVDLFVGQLKSSLSCSECGFCSTMFDPFWDLSLPIAQKNSGEVTLIDCMRLLTREDVLDGEERPTCQRCNVRRKCSKKFAIQKFPQVLVLHLKRFSEPHVCTSKLSTFVDFPLTELDLGEFASDDNAHAVYNLYAVSNHSGNILGGHYTAYCRNPLLGEWYHYNDSRVSPMSVGQVRSNDAYVLFYELAAAPQQYPHAEIEMQRL